MKVCYCIIGGYRPRRFDILTAVKMSMFCWVVTSCGIVGTYQRYEGTYCLHFQGLRLRQDVSGNDDTYLRVHAASQPRITIFTGLVIITGTQTATLPTIKLTIRKLF